MKITEIDKPVWISHDAHEVANSTVKLDFDVFISMLMSMGSD